MAAVKTKRTGPVLKTRFAIVRCSSCGDDINKLEEAYRILSIKYEPIKSKRFAWAHRKCISLGGK
jgi:hypothetical protein